MLRLARLAIASVCVLFLIGCVWRGVHSPRRRLTGTCHGACNHYLACKEGQGKKVYQQDHLYCERECAEVFSGPETILAFESLRCEDTIGFVEGSSGRGPGEPSRAEAAATP